MAGAQPKQMQFAASDAKRHHKQETKVIEMGELAFQKFAATKNMNRKAPMFTRRRCIVYSC